MITLKIFVFNNLSVNTFVLHDETKQAVIVDPACYDSDENQQLFYYIEENKLQPKYIINTHGHVDHIAGVNSVKEHYGIPFYLHRNDMIIVENANKMGFYFGFHFDEIPQPAKYIDESDLLEFGNSALKIFHVPGHSPGSIVFYSEADKFIIAGDVLFRGSIGRTDLPGGDFDLLISGIKSKLLTLPGETLVFSGHGPHTTIQSEHDTNPFLV